MLVFEGLILSKYIDEYHFNLRVCVQMEQKIDISKVRMIFANQLMTHMLLNLLDICDTCTLHGDRYHLCDKFFSEKFGIKWCNISPFVKNIIYAETEEPWDKYYTLASNLLVSDPELYQDLEKKSQ